MNYVQFEKLSLRDHPVFTEKWVQDRIAENPTIIPLVAIQMSALKVGETVGLVFTKVLDHMPLGLVDEDEEIAETTDRAYWEERGSKSTLALTDRSCRWLGSMTQSWSLNITSFTSAWPKMDNLPTR